MKDCVTSAKGLCFIGPGKRGHTGADTLLPTQMFPRLPARATFVAYTNFVSGKQKCFWFCSETFCVRNKCFPVCAAQETSWATICPQQCVLVYQGLKGNCFFDILNYFYFIFLLYFSASLGTQSQCVQLATPLHVEKYTKETCTNNNLQWDHKSWSSENYCVRRMQI